MKVPIDSLEKIITRASAGLNYIGGCVLALLMFLSFSDVVGRYIFSRPILGAYEMIQCMMVVIGAFAVGYCALEKGHVSVDVLLLRFSQRSRDIIEVPISLISLILLVLLTWKSIGYAYEAAFVMRTATDLLHIPEYPFMALVSLGLFMLTIVFFLEFVQSIMKVMRFCPEKKG